MRAVVLDESLEPVLADVPAPLPRPGEVLIGVRRVGLCGSDVEKLDAGTALPGSVLGHEIAGVVLDGVLDAGTRVVVAHHVPCGQCSACLAGHEPLCPRFVASGLRPGGFAERLVASAAHVAETVLELPDHVGDEAATLVEPLACVLRATATLPPGRGVVVGCGAIGILHLRVLAARGDDLRALDPDPGRLALGLAIASRPAAPGDDLDYAVVTAPAGLGEALTLLRPGGTVLLFAASPQPQPVALQAIYRRELVLRGMRSTTPAHLRAALAAIAGGSIPVEDLVTDVLPLDRFADGLARYRKRQALKVVFEP